LLGLYAADLGIDIAGIGLILALGSLVAALGQFPSGYMSDRFGRKRCIVAGGALNAIALISYSVATDWHHLALAVVLSNVALTMTMPSRLALTSESVHANALGSAYGILDTVNYIAKAAGPAVAMFLAARLGLKWVFVFAAFGAGLGACIDAMLLRDGHTVDKHKPLLAHLKRHRVSLGTMKPIAPFAATQALTALFSGFAGAFFYIHAVKNVGLPMELAGLLGAAYCGLMMFSRVPIGRLANGGSRNQMLLVVYGCILGGIIWLTVGSGKSAWWLVAYPMLAFANVMPARNALVANLTDGRPRAQAYGLIGAFEGVAGAASYALAGWLAHVLGMRALFMISGAGLILAGIVIGLMMGGLARAGSSRTAPSFASQCR